MNPMTQASPTSLNSPTALVPDSFVALMYHNLVSAGRTYPDLSPSVTSYFVSSDAFSAHLQTVRAAGGVMLPVNLLHAFYQSDFPHGGECRSDEFGVVLTFDDGWADCVDAGGPALEQHGFQAILFVTTDLLGKPHFLARNDLSRLRKEVFYVGSHARSHRMLSLLGDDEIRAELLESKHLLEDGCGYEIDLVSIPSGAVDARVRRIAREVGYRFLFDSEVHVNKRGSSPFAIGRIAVMHDTPRQTIGRYVQQRIIRERVRRGVLQVPKRMLGLRNYEKLRRRMLGETSAQRVTHES